MMIKLALKLIILLSASSLTSYANQHETMQTSDTPPSITAPTNAPLRVEHPWVKSTIPGVKVSAGYLTLTNNSDQTMNLVGIKTSAAQSSEFHNMIMEDSKMVMRKVDQIEIKPGEQFEFKSGGYHLMFMQLNQSFIAGESITVTLIEKSGQTYDVVMPIISMRTH